MTAIDLCCGMGGLSKGLLDAGIEVVLGVDVWPSALKVYERNLGGAHPPGRPGSTADLAPCGHHLRRTAVPGFLFRR